MVIWMPWHRLCVTGVFQRGMLSLTQMWNGPVSKVFQLNSPSDGEVVCLSYQHGHLEKCVPAEAGSRLS